MRLFHVEVGVNCIHVPMSWSLIIGYRINSYPLQVKAMILAQTVNVQEKHGHGLIKSGILWADRYSIFFLPNTFR